MSAPTSDSMERVSGAHSPPVSPKLNDKTANDEEPLPSNATLVTECEQAPSKEIPTPPQSQHSPDNHLNEEEHSEDSSGSRRRPRGGRKQSQLKKPAQHLQSVSEFELPTRSHPQHPEEEPGDFASDDELEAPLSPLLAPPETEHHEDDYDEAALKNARSKGSRKKHAKPPTRTRSTGISALNIERPRGRGRKPPISVSVERPEEKCKKCSARAKRKSKKKDTQPEERESEEDESEEEEEEKRKPVQIRLDLNLELDILLRAKIKGDITITFL
jgi:hypothetical protein